MLLHEPFPGLLQVVIWVVEEGKLEVGAERDTNVCVCAREWLSIHSAGTCTCIYTVYCTCTCSTGASTLRQLLGMGKVREGHVARAQSARAT